MISKPLSPHSYNTTYKPKICVEVFQFIQKHNDKSEEKMFFFRKFDLRYFFLVIIKRM